MDEGGSVEEVSLSLRRGSMEEAWGGGASSMGTLEDVQKASRCEHLSL